MNDLDLMDAADIELAAGGYVVVVVPERARRPGTQAAARCST